MLHILRFKKVLLVCKGYGEDYELFTELTWEDDRDLNLKNDTQYEDFRIWI
ncbi:hypothetical protein ACWA1C_09740 [Flectobacillus roseus]